MKQLLAGVLRSLQAGVALRAENELLRAQLAVLMARQDGPVRPQPTDRVVISQVSRLCHWRRALVIVRPETLIRWQRAGFRLLWRWRSRRGGRPPLPHEIREVIRRMATENTTWGVRRIRDEARLKLGVRVSAETVRRTLGVDPPPRSRERGQRWSTFIRNHASVVVASDLLTVVTARFQVLYVLVMLEVGSRRLLHWNVTAHPTAKWMQQQMREAIPCDHGYRFLVHDRDCVFSRDVDATVAAMGIRVLKTPIRAPKANAFAERVIGTIRRECLDHVIPWNERHLRRFLREWVNHYNRGRPHQSLGPGIAEPPDGLPVEPNADRHSLPAGTRVVAGPILGGLHHNRLEPAA